MSRPWTIEGEQVLFSISDIRSLC